MKLLAFLHCGGGTLVEIGREVVEMHALRTFLLSLHANKGKGHGPDYRVLASNVEFGAAWKKQSDKENVYLSVKLDDPSFAAPIYASLVEAEGEELSLIWSRRRAAN